MQSNVDDSRTSWPHPIACIGTYVAVLVLSLERVVVLTAHDEGRRVCARWTQKCIHQKVYEREMSGNGSSRHARPTFADELGLCNGVS